MKHTELPLFSIAYSKSLDLNMAVGHGYLENTRRYEPQLVDVIETSFANVDYSPHKLIFEKIGLVSDWEIINYDERLTGIVNSINLLVDRKEDWIKIQKEKEDYFHEFYKIRNEIRDSFFTKYKIWRDGKVNIEMCCGNITFNSSNIEEHIDKLRQKEELHKFRNGKFEDVHLSSMYMTKISKQKCSICQGSDDQTFGIDPSCGEYWYTYICLSCIKIIHHYLELETKK